MLRRIALLSILVLLLLTACDSSSDEPSSSQEVTGRTCPEVVTTALGLADSNCEAIDTNQVCYGNFALEAETSSDAALASPGDIIDFANLQRLKLSPMDVEANEWGIAVMSLQANLAETLPGQAVLFLLFGDVELENRSDDSDGLQSFYFNSGVGDAQCDEAPDSGILVQTPEGMGEVSFVMNDVEIALRSTAFMQSQPEQAMTVNVVEGQAQVTAQGVTQTIPAGNQTQIEVDANGLATGEPSPPEPYTASDLVALPVSQLNETVVIAETVNVAQFTADAEGWGIFQDGTEIEHFSADDTSDGYICSVDRGTGIYWYFTAPESWLGDRSDLYNGHLNYVIRQEPKGNVHSQPTIIIEGAEADLH